MSEPVLSFLGLDDEAKSLSGSRGYGNSESSIQFFDSTGVAFDPVGEGTATVTATAAGSDAGAAQASFNVTVTP